MSILATAKNKAASANVKDAFKNEAGAIDLASIMVGIIVIGLIGGVIAATVFAVIPWAQDNAAKQQLDSVVAAQSAYVGLSADETTGTNNFGTLDQLKTKGLFDGTSLKDSIAVGVTAFDGSKAGSAANSHFAAAVKSSSGNYYTVSDGKTQPTKVGTTKPTTVTTNGVTVTLTYQTATTTP